MFSKIIRLGVALSGAVILSSCGGSSGQAITQSSTPEGLFISTSSTLSDVYVNTSRVQTTTVNSSGVTVPNPTCTQNEMVFVEYSGAFYAFAFTTSGTDPSVPLDPVNLISASSGTFSYSGGTMSSGNVIEVSPPNGYGVTTSAPNGTNCGVPIANYVVTTSSPSYTLDTEATAPTFVGGYNTGINIAGSFTYPLVVDTSNEYKLTTFNINYDVDYQSVQSLATLAGSYTGTVGTSQFSESATFTFGPASVAANSGNVYGVGIVTGVGANGCTYTGTVSPLYKGNGYTMSVTSGSSPCYLPDTQFTGLVYFRQSSGYLYSFAPNSARNDGLIFSGSRNK
jgi:hypothetical protein